MKTGLFCMLLLLMTFNQAFVADDKPGLKVPFRGKFFTTDNLGNLFLVGRDNSIVKVTKDGKTSARVNFKIYGNLEQLDVTNPFEIYAYYRDQQTVLILDNLFNQLGVISLNNQSTGEITAACRSFDNGLWYFDAGNTKIIKTDKSLNKKIESLPFSSWTNESWSPVNILDNEKNLFVNDSTKGIAIFDVFANYYKTIDIKGLRNFQVKKDQIFYFDGEYFQSYDFKFFKIDTILQNNSCKDIRMDGENLYLWQRDTIFIKPVSG
ncbi:MAG: hypothetical protein GC181_01095 [Bacteroidetes bacterium]|nr:hypothetical protein [Bacteroidota bacterium]